MAFKIWRYDEKDLRAMLAEVGDTAAWRARMLAGLPVILRAAPLRYRGYGPYWWPLKKLLWEAGVTEFGEYVDMDWADSLDYGDPDLTLMAAGLYGDQTFERGAMCAAEHEMEMLADPAAGLEAGDTLHFVSADEDLEARAWRPPVGR